MFSIGEFARLGRVSVRMLRHYDAIGLLRPASVDTSNGYRSYTAAQLTRLNRALALKDLGFTLHQVIAIIDEKVDLAELRGMLRLRRAQLAAALAADAARLATVEARLRMIEQEGHMNTAEVVLKNVGAVRIAELTGVAASYGPEDIGPVIGPLYDELMGRLCAAGVSMTGPAIAWYELEQGGTGESVIVHAGAQVAVAAEPGQDFSVVDLPALPAAAAIVHHGPMDDVMASEQALATWIEANGYRPLGYHREVYLDYHPDNAAAGVTELQIPVAKA